MTVEPSLTSPRHKGTTKAIYLALAAILLVGFLFRLNELGQPAIKDLDEAFHAIVARNMVHDPLRPMLYVDPFMAYDYRNWMGNHIWLHKPPLALWQMALSMAFFTESNFTMRLPSLLLSTASVFLTFLIARRLGNVQAGLIAAAFQALSPAITQLVHGQVFSDHVDTALLFYCELCIWMLLRAGESGSARQAIFAGFFMGAGWLSKSFPATFPLGLAAFLCFAGRVTHHPGRLGLSARQFILFLLASVGVCVPWVAWCFYAFPREYLYEQIHVFVHLTHDIEAFGNPWDRLVFDYLVRVMLEWYPLVFMSFLLLAYDAIRRRERGKVFLFLWALGVLVPHLLATSKTPSATLTAWPALWLGAGWCISDALRGRTVAIGIVLASGLLMLRPYPQFFSIEKSTGFAAIMLSQWRLLIEIGIVLLVTLVAALLRKRISLPSPRILAIVLAVVFVFPIGRHVLLAYRAGAVKPKSPVAFKELGRQVRANADHRAVFFVENLTRSEHIIAMWWLDRSCYPLRGAEFGRDVDEVLRNGGTPFILSRNPRPEPVLISVPGEGTIYRLDGPAPAAGKE